MNPMILLDESRESMVERAIALEHEPAVWAEILTERSTALAEADPGGELRAAIGDAIDVRWNHDLIGLISFGCGVVHAWRISMNMSVGGCMRSELRGLADSTAVCLETTLLQAAPHDDAGPDLVVVLGSPDLARPGYLPPGMRSARFLFAAIGGEPGPAMLELAAATGGDALPVTCDADAHEFAGAFVEMYASIRAAKQLRVVGG